MPEWQEARDRFDAINKQMVEVRDRGNRAVAALAGYRGQRVGDARDRLWQEAKDFVAYEQRAPAEIEEG